jgi:hypothetical protein
MRTYFNLLLLHFQSVIVVPSAELTRESFLWPVAKTVDKSRVVFKTVFASN